MSLLTGNNATASTSSAGLLDTVGGIAGAVSAIGGMIQQFRGSAQQFAAAKDLMKDASHEMQAVLQEGSILARNARQRAYASLEDWGFLKAQTDETISGYQEQGRRLESAIVARTAASGLTLTGSPLLVAAEATLQTQRAIGNAQLTEQVGERRFQFEIERELSSAQDMEWGAREQAEGIGKLRAQQSYQMSQGAYLAQTRGIQMAAQTLTSPGTQSLLKSLMPDVSHTYTPTHQYTGSLRNLGEF